MNVSGNKVTAKTEAQLDSHVGANPFCSTSCVWNITYVENLKIAMYSKL